MRRFISSLVAIFGMGIATGAQPAWAFVENRAPTYANGGVNPDATGDPAAVAAAQRALEAFFTYTDREYSKRGYANPWLMREQLGNRQSNWLDKTLPLACGRLVGGWKHMNWIPEKGWQHAAPPPEVVAGASVPCEFEAPTLANSGADPLNTYDPGTVLAAQQALEAFYRRTNQTYSQAGYSNPWSMREDLGNEQSGWLDMTLPLARGHLLGGWKHRNWIPGKGWQHEMPPRLSVARDSLLTGASTHRTLAWIGDPSLTPALPPDVALEPRIPATADRDGEMARIIENLGVDLGGESGQ